MQQPQIQINTVQPQTLTLRTRTPKNSNNNNAKNTGQIHMLGQHLQDKSKSRSKQIVDGAFKSREHYTKVELSYNRPYQAQQQNQGPLDQSQSQSQAQKKLPLQLPP